MSVRSDKPARYGGRCTSTVFFAHGKESGPWGSKIRALAEVAEKRGYRVESPDYSDLMDADERVVRLLGVCGKGGADILVGSSMGGYVSTVASTIIKPKGLFLMAPAFFIPGYAVQEPQTAADKTVIIHGWNDDVVPVEHSIRFAGKYKSQLHLLDSNHRLDNMLGKLCLLFESLLDEINI